jgi:hypothetical protein
MRDEFTQTPGLSEIILSPNSEVGRVKMVVGTARPAGGTNCARVNARLRSVPRLNGAVAAQRAIPTNFGLQVEPAHAGCCESKAF